MHFNLIPQSTDLGNQLITLKPSLFSSLQLQLPEIPQPEINLPWHQNEHRSKQAPTPAKRRDGGSKDDRDQREEFGGSKDQHWQTEDTRSSKEHSQQKEESDSG